MVVVACAVGIALAAGYSAAVARVGPRGEVLVCLGLLLLPVALAFAAPAAAPLVIAGVVAFDAVFALFLVWGFSAQETTLGGIVALAALAAFAATAFGASLVVRGQPGALPLLAALPTVGALALAWDAVGREQTAGGSLWSGLWTVAMLALPAALAAWRELGGV